MKLRMNSMKIKILGEEIDRNVLKCEANKYVHDFKKFQTIRSFGDSIFNVKITINEAVKNQSNLLNSILKFNDKIRPR